MKARLRNTQFTVPDCCETSQAVFRRRLGRKTNQQSRQMLLRGILCFGLCLLAGCGRSGPKLVPVGGTVFLDGKPLA